MKNLIFLSFLLIFSAYSCQKTLSKEQLRRIALENEVMVLHDSIMAKGGKMQQLATELNKFKENKKENQKENQKDTANISKKIDSQVFALIKADDLMMDWMKNYKPPTKRDTNNTAKEMKYLLNEKVKILLVGAQTAQAIKNASILRDKLKLAQKNQ